MLKNKRIRKVPVVRLLKSAAFLARNSCDFVMKIVFQKKKLIQLSQTLDSKSNQKIYSPTMVTTMEERTRKVVETVRVRETFLTSTHLCICSMTMCLKLLSLITSHSRIYGMPKYVYEMAPYSKKSEFRLDRCCFYRLRLGQKKIVFYLIQTMNID